MQPDSDSRSQYRVFATVTGAYWAFTLTDGALRTLVLLHLHALGFAPLEIASMFLLYEGLGVVTNFVGGWLGARFGLRALILAGLSLQVVATAGLALRAGELTVAVVLAAQALSGVAKDLTKTGAKSYTKQVVPGGEAGPLLRVVSRLTGSKNALKGVGLLLGGVLLGSVGFKAACGGMAVLLAAGLTGAALGLPRRGATRAVPLSAMFARDRRIRWLSVARLFLFGSRDAWFVLALPVYLRESLGWSFTAVSAFLALWVIAYGTVQASAPRWIARSSDPRCSGVGGWTWALLLPLAAIAVGLPMGLAPAPLLVAGLGLFGVLFASLSALHSYLIVEFAERDRTSLGVGFYYTANAAGRLVGTLISGVLFQALGGGRDGLVACVLASIVLVVCAGLASSSLASHQRARIATR
ncbi:organoarsenical effux MFS transporter ArsJ [Engelhardtia mirabilis]|uniref:Major Facilitator Superfamily protein n=1 Tax=Engelhardtia mirabilis TaxID=2528011 RepID=A0A518BHD0_9BACT|nr:Major Facilitator Superfamily protein [Planctomycetes bacterium Pla133]QDV00716.1 Major Facilitator Superfamily protein [Planctomycetes bacterium Pla86]